jgi:hypothetical protein
MPGVVRTEMSGQERYRETLTFGSPRRGVVFSVLVAVGFLGMWLTIGGTAGHAVMAGVVGGVMVAIVLVTNLGRLRTTVYDDAILVELVGLGDRRQFRASDLRSAKVGSFNPLTDQDGWGKLRGLGPSLAWSSSLRTGVWLERNDGEPVFIPSARAAELAQAAASIM